MHSRLLKLLLLALAVAILIILVRNNAGTVGPLSTTDFGSLTYKIVLLVFLGSVVLHGRGHERRPSLHLTIPVLAIICTRLLLMR